MTIVIALVVAGAAVAVGEVLLDRILRLPGGRRFVQDRLARVHWT